MSKLHVLWVLPATLILMFVASAYAHEGYTGIVDPVTKYSCCGGQDCAPVPLDVDWVHPVKNGFQVDLTIEQAQLFNKDAKYPIHEMIPFARVLTSLNKATGSPSLYHLCVWGDTLKCLFVVSST